MCSSCFVCSTLLFLITYSVSPSLHLFLFLFFFFFNDTATTEIYTLSLHDALPICQFFIVYGDSTTLPPDYTVFGQVRSEEHTSELQSLRHLVCRLLLEKKKKKHKQLL